MLIKNLSKSKKATIDKNTLADLRRVLKAGRRVGLMDQGQMLGRAIVVAIEEDRILFEPLGPIKHLILGTAVTNIERGVPWDFRVQGLQQITEDSDIYLQCPIPARININSRRSNFRVNTPASEVYELRFEIEERQYEAKILDLSQTGAQIKLLTDEDHGLEIDQVIEDTTLNLDEHDPKAAKIIIRWMIEDDNSTCMGVEFLDMSDAVSDELYRSVCEIQREMLRRIKALEK